MLVLTRKTREQIHIGDNITISILKLKGSTVRIGIEAPRDVRVVRGELPTFVGTLEGESAETASSQATTSKQLRETHEQQHTEEEATVSELEWEVLKKMAGRGGSCLHVRRCAPRLNSIPPLARVTRGVRAAMPTVTVGN